MNENKISVAIVDDDESFARALGRLLRAAGFSASTYPSAEAFLSEHQAWDIDCLILDIQLGGMSGLDLFQALVDARAGFPVIFITALEDEDHGSEARRIGCAAYLRKPVAARILVDAVNRCVRARPRVPAHPPEKFPSSHKNS
ncbi:MAG: response regulator [Opitutaceae bacterium]|nr:response regulator [Opitutaceae bacterium]